MIGATVISKSSCATSAMMDLDVACVVAPRSCCAAEMQPWLSDVIRRKT
jgi:hypothetical protein